MATMRGYGGRFARGEQATAAAPGSTGTAGGPVSGRSLADAGTLDRQAPYAQTGVAPDSAQHEDLAHPELYGAAGPALAARAGELPNWVGRDPSPLGLGDGSYALADARDEGAPVDTPAHGLPGLVAGAYEFSARLHRLGDQGIVDGMAQDGGSYALDYQPAPYLGA